MSESKNKITNWLGFNRIYITLSAILVGMCVFALSSWGLVLGLDFTGGAAIEYRLVGDVSLDDVVSGLSEYGITARQTVSSGTDTVLIKTDALAADQVVFADEVANSLGIIKLQIQNLGPAVAPEMITKTIYAVILASGGILIWIAIQFKKITFGVSAIIAAIHDSIIQIGAFSILGKLFGAEVDFLFVTAVLTTIALSVHDTIVVFDRVREDTKKYGVELTGVANRAISETLRRSIMTSLTLVVVILALVVLGGETIRWFATALLIGTVVGTYSSPFVAVPIYVFIENSLRKARRKKK